MAAGAQPRTRPRGTPDGAPVPPAPEERATRGPRVAPVHRVLGPRHPALARTVVGAFFLVMGGVHLGLVAADPQVYDGFADQSFFAFVRTGWDEIVMAAPAVYGLLLMAGEVVAGSLLLAGGRAARVGWVAVVVFHLLLLLFGWWIWAWAVPATVALVLLARHDFVPTDASATRR